MTKVKATVADQTSLAENNASAQKDRINRTPSLVADLEGKHTVVPGDNTFAAL
jgi:hypothetical protein